MRVGERVRVYLCECVRFAAPPVLLSHMKVTVSVEPPSPVLCCCPWRLLACGSACLSVPHIKPTNTSPGAPHASYTDAFVHTHRVGVCQGPYPPAFIKVGLRSFGVGGWVAVGFEAGSR